MLVVDENTVNKLVKITPEKSLLVCLILVECVVWLYKCNHFSLTTKQPIS